MRESDTCDWMISFALDYQLAIPPPPITTTPPAGTTPPPGPPGPKPGQAKATKGARERRHPTILPAVLNQLASTCNASL